MSAIVARVYASFLLVLLLGIVSSAKAAPFFSHEQPFWVTDVATGIQIDWNDISSATSYRVEGLRRNYQNGAWQTTRLVDVRVTESSIILTDQQLAMNFPLLYIYACDGADNTDCRYMLGFRSSPALTEVNDFYCGASVQYSTSGYRKVCAATMGILPYQNSDQSEAIRTALQTLATENAAQTLRHNKKALYFPVGRYRVDQSIILQQGQHITGDHNRLSILDGSHSAGTPFIGNKRYVDRLRATEISYLALENIQVGFYGRKGEISIVGNIFYNHKSRAEQLYTHRGTHTIVGNVFLRGRDFPGKGYSAYRPHRLTIQKNFMGDIRIYDPQVMRMMGFYFTRLVRANTVAGPFQQRLPTSQGNFSHGWVTKYTNQMLFEDNYVNSSAGVKLYNPQTEANDIYRYSAFSHTQYNELKVIGNYFSGWRGVHWGIRFSNADRLYMISNHIVGMTIATRAYDHTRPFKFMKAYFLNNYLRDVDLNHWQNFIDDPQNPETIPMIELFLLHGNCLEDSGIYITWRSTLNQNFKLSPEGNDQCTMDHTRVTSNFRDITPDQAMDLVPESVTPYLNKAIPLLD